MNGLKKKYLDYMRLANCKAEYELDDGTKIEVTYKKEKFAHLLGLHKLKDIQERYENFSYENLTTLNYTDADDNVIVTDSF